MMCMYIEKSIDICRNTMIVHHFTLKFVIDIVWYCLVVLLDLRHISFEEFWLNSFFFLIWLFLETRLLYESSTEKSVVNKQNRLYDHLKVKRKSQVATIFDCRRWAYWSDCPPFLFPKAGPSWSWRKWIQPMDLLIPSPYIVECVLASLLVLIDD